MNTEVFKAEQPVNYEQKCPCVLVLDTSTSMQDEPIRELNQGLQTFHNACMADSVTRARLDISIVTFDSEVKVVQPFAPITKLSMPTLNAQGSTRLVDGVRKALSEVDARKSWFLRTGQMYFRPYVILLTDGEPDPQQDIATLARDLQRGVDENHFVFWAFGVNGANMEKLARISPTRPLYIKDMDMGSFFKWLSASFSVISRSKSGEKLNLLPSALGQKPDLFEHSA